MTTRDQVKQLRERNPEIKAVDMAKSIGVSKARVRAVLISEGMPTRLKIKTPFWNCIKCGKNITRKVRFCSDVCKQAYYYQELNCLNCSSLILIKRSVLKKKKKKSEKTFCSYSCRHLFYWKTDSKRMRGIKAIK